jgi:hypothetical protein
MKKLFNWIINKWLAGFTTAGIFFILKLYIDLPAESKSNFFSFKWLVDLMYMPVTLLTLLITILVIIILTRIEKALLKFKYTKDDYKWLKVPKIYFEKYNSDVFGVNQTKWCWRYEWKPLDRKFEIIDLKPVCRQCGTAMNIPALYFHFAECHKCRLEGREYNFHLNEDIRDIEKEIIRRIENNEIKI